MSNETRFVACDLGSNALRLVVSRAFGDGPRYLQREASYRVPLRLAADVFRDGLVSEEKAGLLVEACKAFRHLINVFAPVKIRACATSALREARNGTLVVERVNKESGLCLELIGGDEEARISLSNASGSWLSSDKDYLFVDVGGGSTEITLLMAGNILRSASFRIGSVRLLAERAESSEWLRMKEWLDALPKAVGLRLAIGSGGNISKIYDLATGVKDPELTRERLQDILNSLEPLTAEQRVLGFGLKPDRADVIVPAGRIYAKIMDWANLSTMLVPKLGLADGILAELFQQHYGYYPTVIAPKGKVEVDGVDDEPR